MKICITGGAGYVGSALVPHLLKSGHDLTVLDTFWFGDCLPKENNKLTKIRGDIRNRNDLIRAFKKQDAVIHLACVSNDPSFDMNPNLGKEINYTCFKELLSVLSQENVARFIYASSSSIYGISDLDHVSEEAPKNPLTDYSKYKLACEAWLKSYGTGGVWTIIRPATVCGFAPRMRFDLVVNILTMQAIVKRKITLFGKTQLRPNIDIRDMVLAYDFALNKNPKYVDQKTWNVGFENLSLLQIANLVKSVVGSNIQIVEEPTNDPRSYHICSDKILDAGFKPLHTIKGAIKSIQSAFDDGKFFDPIDNDAYYNIKRMKKLELV